MNELLLRIETLCLDVNPSLLVGIGAGVTLVGLVLWLGGTRYSTVVIGLLGAAVGAVLGLAVAQQLGVHLFISMAVGALVLGIVSVLLRNILMIVLATLIFALVGAAGYAGVVLDKQPPEEATTDEQRTAMDGQSYLYQSFSSMDPNTRQTYLNEISGSDEDFQGRSKAILKDTWDAMGPTKWYLMGAILVGGITGFLLIWFIKQVIVPLCYSIVGAASLILGAQMLLLGLGFRLASALPVQRWILPAAFGGMTAFGWVSQVLAARKLGPKVHKGEDDSGDE
ncbi:MAG: hypothetical protein JSW27_05005 [Phycisphaerales bacterium]|nr:MAG: hypothetical protein JSW27_05005 [Phycisphaerales bacterium]